MRLRALALRRSAATVVVTRSLILSAVPIVVIVDVLVGEGAIVVPIAIVVVVGGKGAIAGTTVDVVRAVSVVVSVVLVPVAVVVVFGGGKGAIVVVPSAVGKGAIVVLVNVVVQLAAVPAAASIVVVIIGVGIVGFWTPVVVGTPTQLHPPSLWHFRRDGPCAEQYPESLTALSHPGCAQHFRRAPWVTQTPPCTARLSHF
jgi:hypothetical protein